MQVVREELKAEKLSHELVLKEAKRIGALRELQYLLGRWQIAAIARVFFEFRWNYGILESLEILKNLDSSGA